MDPPTGLSAARLAAAISAKERSTTGTGTRLTVSATDQYNGAWYVPSEAAWRIGHAMVASVVTRRRAARGKHQGLRAADVAERALAGHTGRRGTMPSGHGCVLRQE